MSTTFPFTTCCQLLGIDPKTARSWLAEANIEPMSGPLDSRLKLFTLEQIYQLAVLYRRSITPPADLSSETRRDASSLQMREGSMLFSQETEMLSQKLSQLESRLATVCDHLTSLALLLAMPRARHAPPLQPLPHPTEENQLGTLGASERETEEQEGEDAHGWHPLPAELRARTHVLPLIEYGAQGSYIIISPQAGELSLLPDSPEWFDWLASLISFRFVGKQGRLSAYRVHKDGGPTRSWKACRYAHDREYKLYLGITPRLTISQLEQAAATLGSRVASL